MSFNFTQYVDVGSLFKKGGGKANQSRMTFVILPELLQTSIKPNKSERCCLVLLHTL